MKGPRPTPTVLKILRGNPGRRAINTSEPEPGALDPRTPRELADKDARAEWRRTIVPAIATGQITAADRSLAILHCSLWATWVSQNAIAAERPHVTLNARLGSQTPNVVRGMANKTIMLIAKVDAELGLSPSSRSRVKAVAPAAKSANPLDRFLKKGGAP